MSLNSSNATHLGIDDGGHFSRQPAHVLQWFEKKNAVTLQGARAFVPWILQEAYWEHKLQENHIVFHTGQGAVVFSDASGFTALTEKLAVKSNGAELLSQCLTAFFTPLIDLINAYRGDVIKFSGDALTIYFPAVNDKENPKYNLPVPPHGTYGLDDLGPMSTCVLRASACCIEIHKRLHMFDTGVDDVRLCLHIGVGCGEVTLLQVGGVIPPETHVPRLEYIISGAPIEQISIAEPLAKNGQTCLSPQAWRQVENCVIEGPPLEDRPDFHLLQRMDEQKYTFPTIKYTAMQADFRTDKEFGLPQLSEIRRYIPTAVYKQIEGGTLTYVNEMRMISTIFISGSGVDVSTDEGPNVAQDLMVNVQKACYAYEGTLNKFVIDDKGMLFLLVFGLPPLVHTDDPARAVLACFDMVKVFKRLGLIGRFGVTTGRNYCGICGSKERMEYTVLGDTVNLSARLMGSAAPLGILVDDPTKNLAHVEITTTALPPQKFKGKANPIPIFQPHLKEPPAHIGLGPGNKVYFPWYERPFGAASVAGGSRPGSAGDSRPNVASAQNSFSTNVRHLCGLRNWAGINKIQAMLGGTFSSSIHQTDQVITNAASGATAPATGPFAEGGIVVIEGPTGIGKLELAEHVVLHCASQLKMLPIFGTMGPRPGDYLRVISELLRSSLGVFRHLNPAMDNDDCKALASVLPQKYAAKKAWLDQLMRHQFSDEDNAAIFELGLQVFVALLNSLAEKRPLIVTLQLEYGTTLFSRSLEVFNCFWTIANRLTEIAENKSRNPAQKPITIMLLIKTAEKDHSCMVLAKAKHWHVKLQPLSEENIIEYTSKYLNVRENLLPAPLRQFVAKITLGNPLYVRETIDQLKENKHITLSINSAGNAESVKHTQDLEAINISSWSFTAMVGETICLLESLDPLEAAVLKMSTVFVGDGGFTLPDLASSSCSRWAGSTHFDYLRLYNAIKNLVKRDIIEQEVTSEEVRLGSSSNRPKSYFLRNVLIRKVGASMVLEAQKKAVKRQALMDRAINRDLPKRLEEIKERKKIPHVPWYYENVLKRMPKQ